MYYLNFKNIGMKLLKIIFLKLVFFIIKKSENLRINMYADAHFEFYVK